MKFGIFDHMEFRGSSLTRLYEDRLRLLEYADQSGFWCYHKAEHHFIPLDAAPSANVFLAAASQRTTNIRLGSLVYLLPFYEPIRLVEEICSLDHLSNGRLEIGVGKGISPAEHSLWGLDPTTARARFEEYFEIIRLGLTNNMLNFHGETRHYDNVPLPHRPKQDPHPAIWYPGNVDYAGRHRLNTIIGGPAKIIAQAIETYRSLTADPEANWNPGVATPTIGATRHLYVTKSKQDALARIKVAYPIYHQNLAVLFKKYNVAFPTPPGDPSMGGDIDRAMMVEGLVAGSPDDVAQHIQNLINETSIEYLIFSFAWGDLAHDETFASMQLFVNEVMPRFI